MTWKTMWLSIVAGVIAMIMVPYFSSSMVTPDSMMGNLLIAANPKVPVPFAGPEDAGDETSGITGPFSTVDVESDVAFIDADLQTGWIPWIIKQVSILIGALSLVVFLYAGINLIIRGDNEEELSKSTKMIIFGVVGIALAAFSYTIIANLLTLFV